MRRKDKILEQTGAPDDNRIRPGITLGASIEAVMTQPGTESDNSIQTLSQAGEPDSGTWKLRIYGQNSSPLDHDCAASDVETFLDSIPEVGTGNVTCTGGPIDVAEVEIEFTVPKAEFEMVQPGSPSDNCIQRLTLTGNASTRQWQAVKSSSRSSQLDFFVTSSELQTALEGISSIGQGNVTCTGGPLDSGPIDIEFVGDMANTAVDLLEVQQSYSVPLVSPLFGMLEGGDDIEKEGFGHVAKLTGALGSESRQYETVRVYNRFRTCGPQLQCLYANTGRGDELVQVECEGE